MNKFNFPLYFIICIIIQIPLVIFFNKIYELLLIPSCIIAIFLVVKIENFIKN